MRGSSPAPCCGFVSTLQERFFTVPGSDGKEVDLVPNASSTRVTFENKDMWARLALEYRLKEFDRQVRGMLPCTTLVCSCNKALTVWCVGWRANRLLPFDVAWLELCRSGR